MVVEDQYCPTFKVNLPSPMTTQTELGSRTQLSMKVRQLWICVLTLMLALGQGSMYVYDTNGTMVVPFLTAGLSNTTVFNSIDPSSYGASYMLKMNISSATGMIYLLARYNLFCDITWLYQGSTNLEYFVMSNPEPVEAFELVSYSLLGSATAELTI